MKNLLLLLFLFLSSFTFGQVFYQGANDDDFKSLIKNGVTFLPTGDEVSDNAYISAFKNYWKVSELKVSDSNTQFAPEDIIVTELYIDDSELVLAMINYKLFKKMQKSSKGISKYATIGYINLKGFDQTNDKGMIKMMKELKNVPENFKKTLTGINSTELHGIQTIKGLNDAIAVINVQKIEKSGVGLYKALFKAIFPKSAVLKTKTLLMVGATEIYVDLKALEKNGIKYESISVQEYQKLDKTKLDNYCLMYFAYGSYTEISIYDLATHDLIYTRHFAGAKKMFDDSDIREIAKQWK